MMRAAFTRGRYFIREAGNTGPKNRIFQVASERNDKYVKATDAISENKPKEFLCGRCGHKHRPRECPAYGQQCTVCHKLHHFARVCHSKQLINVNKNTKSSNPSNSRRKVHTVHKMTRSLIQIVNHKYLYKLYMFMA